VLSEITLTEAGSWSNSFDADLAGNDAALSTRAKAGLREFMHFTAPVLPAGTFLESKKP